MWLAIVWQNVASDQSVAIFLAVIAVSCPHVIAFLIAYARQFYNVNALDYNTRIQSFPGNQLARWFRFEPVVFFETEAGVSQEVQVSFAKG